MSRVVCTTQEEVDVAAEAGHTIVVDDAWRGSARVVARESARVEARGSARVEAWESASVVARESASVEAWGSASVVAWGSARVVARESARVEARGSASVEAWESASVVARGSASVEAWESASVVLAGKYTVVQDHGPSTCVTGQGQRIVIPALDTAGAWVDYHGAEVADGHVTLHKAVGPDWRSGHGLAYEPGSTVEASDWRADGECGGGLHLCADPHSARWWRSEDDTRIVTCRVALADVNVIDEGKVKARRVEVLAWTHRVERGWLEPVEGAVL